MSIRNHRMKKWAKEHVMDGQPNKTMCDVPACQTGGELVPDSGRVLCHFHATKRRLWASDNAREIGFRAALREWDESFPRQGGSVR